jgi:hypothetical protein
MLWKKRTDIPRNYRTVKVTVRGNLFHRAARAARGEPGRPIEGTLQATHNIHLIADGKRTANPAFRQYYRQSTV